MSVIDKLGALQNTVNAITSVARHELRDAYEQGRADAIDKVYEIAKTKMDLLMQQTQGRRNGKIHAMYCMQALEFMRETVLELKEQSNGNNDFSN